MTETLDRCYLEYSNITQARSRRELTLAKAIERMIRTQDAWKADMEANPVLPKGEVVRDSYAKMREARHDAWAVLQKEMK